MNARRHQERPLRLIHVQPTGPRSGLEGESWRRDEYGIDPRSGSWATAGTPLEPDARTAVLLELDPERALLTAPSTATPVGADGSGRLSAAVLIATAAERQLQRDLDRLRRYERFVVLADLLAAADSPSTVFETLRERLAPVIDAWITLVFCRVRSNGAGSPTTLRSIPTPGLGNAQLSLEASPAAPLPHLGQLSWDDTVEPGDLLAPVRRIFEATPIRRMAYASIGDDAIVFVADRRAGREFGAQDWDMLRVVIRQAEAAIKRQG